MPDLENIVEGEFTNDEWSENIPESIFGSFTEESEGGIHVILGAGDDESFPDDVFDADNDDADVDQGE